MTTPQGKWYLNPWMVLALTFFVLGPLGLPLVYKCPNFGRKTKIFLTILVSIYTVYLGFLAAKTGQQTYKRILELQETMLAGSW